MNIEVSKVVQEDGKYVKGAKRQRIPYQVNWDCPGCGKRKTQDWTERYLSYPKWNTENTESLYCHDCGTEVRVNLVPSLSINIEVRQSDTE